jgi:hypothetical protein
MKHKYPAHSFGQHFAMINDNRFPGLGNAKKTHNIPEIGHRMALKQVYRHLWRDVAMLRKPMGI